MKSQSKGTSFFGKYYPEATKKMQAHIRSQVLEPFVEVSEPATVRQALDAVDISQINMYPILGYAERMKEVTAAFDGFNLDQLVWEFFGDAEEVVEIQEVLIESPRPILRPSAAARIVPPTLSVPHVSMGEDLESEQATNANAEVRKPEVPSVNVHVSPPVRRDTSGAGRLVPPATGVPLLRAPPRPVPPGATAIPLGVPGKPQNGSQQSNAVCTCSPTVLFGKETHSAKCELRKKV